MNNKGYYIRDVEIWVSPYRRYIVLRLDEIPIQIQWLFNYIRYTVETSDAFLCRSILIEDLPQIRTDIEESFRHSFRKIQIRWKEIYYPHLEETSWQKVNNINPIEGYNGSK